MKTLTRKKPGQKSKLITVGERLERLAELDLSRINAKVRRELGWTQEQSDESELWYRRFIRAIIRFPKRTKYVPNMPIDEFWHAHIMDTKAYARDCHHVLGRFLHHNPYFGVRGAKDLEANKAAFRATNAIYREMFGEDCTQMVHFQGKGAAESNCDTGITCNGQ